MGRRRKELVLLTQSAGQLSARAASSSPLVGAGRLPVWTDSGVLPNCIARENFWLTVMPISVQTLTVKYFVHQRTFRTDCQSSSIDNASQHFLVC